MKTISALLFAWALLNSASAFASWKLENSLNLTPLYYFESAGQNTSMWSAPIRDQLTLGYKANKDLKFRLAPYFYSDPSSTSPSEQAIFDLQEANVDFHHGDFRIKTGINSIAWGVTDICNPMDVVSARRYTDLLNAEKRGVPSVELLFDNGPWLAEAIYVPVNFPSIMPGENSRWLPRDLVYDRDTPQAVLTIGNPFQYHYAENAARDDAFHNNFGFRLEHHGSALDIQAIFFQGSPTAPAILTPLLLDNASSIIGQANLIAYEVTLQPVYYLRRTVGLGAVLTLDTTIIRFAVSNSDRMNNEGDLPGWAQAAVLGVEKNFSVWDSTLTALLQATYGAHEDQDDNTVTSLDRVFDQSWLLGLRLATSADWNFSAAGLYDSLHQGGYIQVKMEHKLRDGLLGTLASDWIDGGSGSPLGSYRINKRVIAGLTVSL